MSNLTLQFWKTKGKYAEAKNHLKCSRDSDTPPRDMLVISMLIFDWDWNTIPFNFIEHCIIQ